jgi:hypothetical protein
MKQARNTACSCTDADPYIPLLVPVVGVLKPDADVP